MEISWPYLAVALGLLGFILEMALRFRRDMFTVRHEQSGLRRQIDITRKKGSEQQKIVAEFKTEIADLKSEKQSLARDIEIAKETLAELETRAERRSSKRLED